MSALHPVFCDNMRHQLGQEADAYFASFDEPAVRGIRLNPLKNCTVLPEGLGEKIPWADGCYLSAESTAGADPLHEAGAWYLQEASAMIPASLIAAKPGECVLDLCSAPGGKATQLGAAMAGKGLLVCNEPVPARAKILSRNIERMGITNALVVNEMPEKLARQWPGLFDAIVVDAPCSGEGMFRRHPETRDEWEPSSPEGCAERQKKILTSAIEMLKPGGRMVYSTCTFNSIENEDVCAWLCEKGMIPVPFVLQGNTGLLEAPEGMLHIYPHKVRGEGHFAAFFRKPGEIPDSDLLAPADQRLGKPTPDFLKAYSEFKKSGIPAPEANACLGDSLISAPLLPPLRGIHVLRAGLQLGQLKGRVFQPDHALALSITDPAACPHISLTREEAILYQHGEVIAADGAPKGYVIAEYAGMPLGFGKVSDGQMKNHYPKGLRR